MNPYNWRKHQPRVEIVRPGLAGVAEELLRGGSGVLLAGRGMGKSVFLRQLRDRLEERREVRTVLFPVPPSPRSAEGWFRALASRLGSPVEHPTDAHEVIAPYLAAENAPRRLVLLFDEFDRYAGACATSSIAEPPLEHPGRDFFDSLESMRRDFDQVGILAAGGIGVFVFRDVLGSSFLARADKVRLAPFGAEDIGRLARPFAEDDRALDPELLGALEILTGGNPALVTYGLQALWDVPRPDLQELHQVFARFEDQQAEFLRDFQLSFSSNRLSEAPRKVWHLIQTSGGEISQGALDKACAEAEDLLQLNGADVLDLLESAGLVRVSGSVRANPVRARPVAGLLSLPPASPSSPKRDVAQRLAGDLGVLLARLHASSADFFRPGRAGEGVRLVPEAVFSTYLGLGFNLLGWQAEREVQRGAGRADLLLRWNGSRQLAVIEVKIWGRNDYREAQRQVESDWTSGVEAGAVVMLSDAELDDGPARYRERCLEGYEVDVPAELGLPASARFRVRVQTRSALHYCVDHFLVRLARR